MPLNWRTESKVKSVADSIKDSLKEEFDGVINATVGVAPNGWLAKMGSKMKKPNGFMMIQSTDLPDILFH